MADGHSVHLGFSMGTVLAMFDQQVVPTLPTKFWVNTPFGLGVEAQIRFQDGGHFGHLDILFKTILAIFNLQKKR